MVPILYRKIVRCITFGSVFLFGTSRVQNVFTFYESSCKLSAYFLSIPDNVVKQKRLENEEKLSSAISDLYMTNDLLVVLSTNSLHKFINFVMVKPFFARYYNFSKKNKFNF